METQLPDDWIDRAIESEAAKWENMTLGELAIAYWKLTRKNPAPFKNGDELKHRMRTYIRAELERQ